MTKQVNVKNIKNTVQEVLQNNSKIAHI
jgi:hypothetical protein